MSSNCIFCRIVAGEASADIIYADDEITAFRDIMPQARVHVLVIPNKHYVSLNDATAAEPDLPGRLVQVAVEVAEQEGISESGYRVATNTGPDARQSVDHLHFHVLGGERMTGRLV